MLSHAFSESQIAAAALCDNSAWNLQLEAFRGYLLAVARRRIHPNLHGRLDMSGVVQETLWEATVDRHRVAGASSEDCARWLRHILQNNLRDACRRLQTDKRAAAREVLRNSSILRRVVAEDQSTAESRAERAELSGEMSQAIARLPDSYRQVIELRNRDNLRFAEIGSRLSITENAAQKLWVRALRLLEEALEHHR